MQARYYNVKIFLQRNEDFQQVWYFALIIMLFNIKLYYFCNSE